MPDLSFGYYSGYVPINGTQKQLHYVATLSKNKPATDPVIFWYNGGPGCSSMLGLLQENGPYIIDNFETEFKVNNYSWNNEANMIFIEAPAGVGFSICPDAAECKFTDDSTASDNLIAVLNIFLMKFPELQSNDIYITGESYAGIYIPTLA
jgi:carboxypeptidase C (cathepsin A)